MYNLLKNTYRRSFFYHFTDKRNVNSILRNGLLPRCLLTNSPYIPGGNQWSIEADDRFGLDHYVHCCFLNEHPMECRAKEEGRIDPTWLKIRTELLQAPLIVYSAGVSNQAGRTFLNNDQAKKELDFVALFQYLNWRIPENQTRRQTCVKYEILIPFAIPKEYIEVM